MSATQLDRIESMLKKLIAQTAPRQPSDDEKVFKDPPGKYWDGPSYAGNKMSECEAGFLRALAKYKNACAFMNRKEGDASKAQYAERDDKTAALARQWAEYRESTGDDAIGPAPPMRKPSELTNEPDDADVPF